MSRNQLPAHTGHRIKRRNWHNDLPEPERDDTETLGLPVPVWVELWPVPREKEQAR